MIRLSLLCLCALTSCTALINQTPIVRSITVQESPDAAYLRANRAIMRLGGEVTQANPQSRTLSAKLHNAVILNVIVEQVPEGARIEAVGTLMPNKIAVGTFDEVDQYLALLH